MEVCIEIEDADVSCPSRQVCNALLTCLNPGNGGNLEYTRDEKKPVVNSTSIRKNGRPRKLTPLKSFFSKRSKQAGYATC